MSPARLIAGRRPAGDPAGLRARPLTDRSLWRAGRPRSVSWVSKPEGAAARDLPRPTTSFVGRGEELRRLGRIVAGGRLVTLPGPAGAGKTRLSLEVAARAGGRFPDGVHFADLAGLHEPELVPRVVATAAMSVSVQGGKPCQP